MAIEVKELIIKGSVGQSDHPAAAAAPAQGNNNSVSSTEDMVNACVEKILEILKEKNER